MCQPKNSSDIITTFKSKSKCPQCLFLIMVFALSTMSVAGAAAGNSQYPAWMERKDYAPFVSDAATGNSQYTHSQYALASQCLSCHKMALPTHPTGLLKAPSGGQENVTCFSCHDCSGGTCLLIKPVPLLCLNCHSCTKGMACAIRTAHMGDAKDIDSMIEDCTICHDGATANLVDSGAPGEHPVNVSYPSINDSRYRFMSTIDQRVVLTNRQVTCLSCHNPYASGGGRLVMKNYRSKLCFACHNL